MKGAYNTKRKKRREKRTPEQVEAEKAAQRTRMRGLRRARKAVELAQAGGFAKTKLWEVPGRDYKLKHFTEDPHQAVLAYYANSGSWRDREARMLMAWVHVRKTLNRELDDAKDAAGVERAERKLHCLSVLNRERLEDRVTLCQVVYEHIDERDWESMLDWQTKNGVNSFERAALEWLVTKGLHCGDDCKLLREKRKRAPIVDAWARSLIGMKLKVPGRWWGNWPSRYARRKYDCEVVDVDYEGREAEEEEEDDKRYFVIRDGDGNRYPMEYKHVREYQRGVEQKKKFDVPLKASTNPIDEDFEKLCKDALEDLNASNHGSVYEKDYTSIEEEAKRIICTQLVTPEKQQELGQRFLESQRRGVSWGGATQDLDRPLLTCASCGFRASGVGGCKDVKSLVWAELDDAQRLEHYERMEKPPLHLPINDKGGPDDFKPVETWKAYSRWPAKKPDELTRDTTLPDWMFCKNGDGELDRSKPKYFHLHPEFVEEFTDDNVGKDFKASLCGNCCEFVPSEKTKAPARSVASGVDFGSPRRLRLVQLTPRERQMISKVRHYSNAIKIESNTGRQREISHSAIKGHSILFDHDCPQVVKNVLSEDSIIDSIEIHFVGPDGQYDHLAKKALGSAQVCARPFAVYQWLKVLRDVNEWYSGDDELDDFPVVVERIEKCNKALVEEAVVVTADKKTARETAVGRDDIREVRVASGRGEAASVNEVSYLLPKQCSLLGPSGPASGAPRVENIELSAASNYLLVILLAATS